MGCFNVAGSMSNLSIGHGDKVVFIPLMPNSMNYRLKKEEQEGSVSLNPSSMLVSNDGASFLYCPVFLPIKGEYNDYGSLENIERDSNVEFIEKLFGITIEQFMEQVTRNWCGDDNQFCDDPEKEKILKSLSGMFELQKVYDDMVAYGKKESSIYSTADLSIATLKQIGFIHNKDKETGDKRYSKYLEHPDLSRIVIYSDGNFSNVYDLETNKEIEYVYGLDDLDKELEKLGINLSEYCDLDSLKNNSVYLLKIDEAIEKKIKKDEVLERIKNNPESPELTDLIISVTLLDSEESIYQLRAWSKMRYCVSEEFKDAFLDFLNFDSMMFSTNNFYAPAMSGEQHGNLKASEALNKSMAEHIQERIDDEYEDYE